MRTNRTVRVIDVENGNDPTWIDKVGTLSQPHQDPYFELTVCGQSMNMRAVAVVLRADKLRITTTQGEIFVFEIVSEDEYGLLANGRADNWYAEIEEQIATEKKWLLIQHPNLFPDEVRVLLGNTDEVDGLIDALQQIKKTLPKRAE